MDEEPRESASAEPDLDDSGAPAATEESVVDGLAQRPGRSRRGLTFILAQSALLSGLTRFVPVPLLDDFLLQNVQRVMIAMLLKREGRAYHTSHVEPLYAGTTSLFDGCVGWFVWLPVTVVVKLLKKLFKSVFVFLLIREAGLTIGHTLLLGHCVHRSLARGAFAAVEDDPTARALLDEATLFRKAFDAAFAGSDRRLLSQLLGVVFTKVGSLPRLGARAVRAMFNRRALREGGPGEIPEGSRRAVDEGVRELQETLEREEVKSFLRDFEETFDRALEHQRVMAERMAEQATDLPPAGCGH